MSVIPRFDGMYGYAYDAVVSRDRVLRVAGAALGAEALSRIPGFTREAFGEASDQPLLDVPCGALASLAHAGYLKRSAKLVGVDLSQTMLERARRRVRRLRPSFEVELVHADALELPFTNAAFGTALSINGLHCVSDPAAFLTELARVLQPGGRLYLMTLVDSGSRSSRGVNAAFRVGGVIPSAPPTLDRVRSMLVDAGFSDVEVDAGSGLVALTCTRS